MWSYLILLTYSLVGYFSIISGAPSLNLSDLSEGYHGVVKESEKSIDLEPKLRADGGPICSYKILNKRHGEIPFDIRILDTKTGEAVMVATKELNCEKRKSYKFSIAAVACDTKEESESAVVRISVEDVNEYEPHFLQSSYIIEVEEGKIYEKITQLEAEDEDCSVKFKNICKYEILTPNQPFTIDIEGIIRNTEPLNWERNHNHILTVKAYDCGMKPSHPVTVNIKVNKVCKIGWQGISERIEYSPQSGQHPITTDATLDLCDSQCEPEKITTKVILTTQHIGKGCDRDTYSVKSQRKLCGASADSVDLLPTPGIGAEWTKNLPTDEGHESDQIYAFDGENNAVVIPIETITHDLTDHFTIATWMKHEQHMEQNHKDHIICNADDHKMNRHHYALFVRNCRLIFLLRRDYTQENLNTFRPAEWRWKIPQVCDNEWHHYAINVNFPEVVLFIEGKQFTPEKNNPEVIDDWPLHAARGINTTLVVGACWQGAENRMDHYFKGFLAGLTILRGKNEKPEVLQCLHSCKEGLELSSLDKLEPGMEILSNSDNTEFSIEGRDPEQFGILLNSISYINSREFPTPGRRNIRIITDVKCKNDLQLEVPIIDSYIMVLQPEKPTILITGSASMARDYENIKNGVLIFEAVTVTVSQDKEEEQMNKFKPSDAPPNEDHKLDSCSITASPPLNLDHEHFSVPQNLMAQLGLEVKQNKDGIIILGADNIYNYIQVLRQIHYFNKKPAYYLNRSFKLVCSELNGRFVSNDFQETLIVIHPQPEVAQQGQSVVDSPKHNVKAPTYRETPAIVSNLDRKLVNDRSKSAAPSGNAVTVIIVVCVGFLVFMIVLGVIRIRAAHQRAQESREEDQEMAWDDSSLTITVNPMEHAEEEQETHPLHDDDSDTSDDGSSYHDELESSEDEAEKVKDRELEWDDSTLTF